MHLDADKRTSKNGKTKKAPQKEEVSEEEESENEVDDDPEFEPNEAEESSAGETEGEESEEEILIEKKKETSQGQKRKKQTKTSPPKKVKVQKDGKVVEKKKKKENKAEQEKEGETFVNSKEKPNFDSGKVDFNLYTEDPNNILSRTVQISKTLKVSCKMINGAQMFAGKVAYPDWPGLVFHKKIKDGKVFEFNTNLTDLPNLIKALQYIMKENPNFFAK